MDLNKQALISLLLMASFGFGNLAWAETPATLYETFIPGYTIPHARDIAVDDAGNAYLIGSEYQDGQHLDLLVFKIDALGNLLWTRYIVGNNHDYATGIALNSSGDVWVTGWTDSSDFPMVDPMDGTLTGFRDVFLMKLDPADGHIVYSTFIGGDYADAAQSIAIGPNDEIYLTGEAGSTDFPTTPDAYQPGPSFPEYFYQDAFIAKLSPTGNEILYSTYFGGTHDDWGDHIALDAQGNIIIAGRSEADDFPLVDPYDSIPNDTFISKLSADGSTLLFSSFFGGSDYDRLIDMRSDGAGNLYLAGGTRSVNFPTSSGAYQENFVGSINGCEVPFGADYNCEDFFVSKLSTNGDGLHWSTFIGGTRVEFAKGIDFDSQGNAYVAGYTSSDDFPMYPGTFGAAIVVCKLSDEGSELDWVHSVDSGSANRGNGIALDSQGDIYFTGTVGVPASIYVSKLQGDRVTAIDDGPASHAGLLLAANYPNPFNPKTNIAYTIPEGSDNARVSLGIYDVGGRLLKQMVDGPQSPGSYDITWDGRDEGGQELSAGVYFYRLRWGQVELSKSMVMVK